MRQPITLKIKFKSGSLDQFIERYSVDVSRGGIFIRTKEPLQIGTPLKFEFQLQDSSALISGEGTVVWTREPDPSRTGVAPGMGVRFDKIAPASAQVLDQILSEKTKRGDGQLESRFDAGVRATASASGAVSSAPARSRPSDFDPTDSKALTPLPRPMPGFDAPENEFTHESTRVMQDEVVQRLAEKTRGARAPAPADELFNDEPTRARSSAEIDDIVKRSAQVASSIGEAAPVISSANKPPPAKPPVREEIKVEAPKPKPEVKPAPPVPVVDLPPPPPPRAAEPIAAGAVPAIDVRPEAVSRPLAAERPPARKRSSSLPTLALVGVVVAAGVGYVVLHNSGTTEVKPETPVATNVPPAVAPTPAPPTAPKTVVVDPAGPKAAPAEPTGATVAVSSDPPGATVFLDGTEHGTTPGKLDGLDPKKTYDVRLAMKGFHDYTTKLTPKSAGPQLEAKLVANEKDLEVSSTPAGADVFLDGKRVGRTPTTLRKMDVSKDHQLELRRGGFVTQTRNVGASDAWESKPEGRDVLALALTLEAQARSISRPMAHTRPAVTVKKGEPGTTATPVGTATEPTGDQAVDTAPTATDKPATDKPAVDKPATDKPATDKPAVDKPATDKPATDKPATKPAATDKPAAKPATTDKPATDKPATDKPADDDKIKTPAWMKKGDKPDTTQDTEAQ